MRRSLALQLQVELRCSSRRTVWLRARFAPGGLRLEKRKDSHSERAHHRGHAHARPFQRPFHASECSHAAVTPLAAILEQAGRQVSMSRRDRRKCWIDKNFGKI